MSKEKKKQKRKIPDDQIWCPRVMLIFGPGAETGPKYERCPSCNKRLKVLFHDCHDHNPIDGACLHPYIPRHKNKKA